MYDPGKTVWGTEEPEILYLSTRARSHGTVFRLLYPHSSKDKRSVPIRRGDWINLSVNLLFSDLAEHIYVNCAEVPLRTHARQQLFVHGAHEVSLGVKLRDVTRGDGASSNAFCGNDHNLPSIPEDGTCGCLLRFHGRYFPIGDRRAKRGAKRGANICFEFPILENSSEVRRDYEYVDTHAFSLIITLKFELLDV